jgi:hypothetical protein
MSFSFFNYPRKAQLLSTRRRRLLLRRFGRSHHLVQQPTITRLGTFGHLTTRGIAAAETHVHPVLLSLGCICDDTLAGRQTLVRFQTVNAEEKLPFPVFV